MDGLTPRTLDERHAPAATPTPAATLPGTAAGAARVLIPMLPSHLDLAVAARRDPAADLAAAVDAVPSRT